MGTNRLAGSESAYLRSAAQQPVHWFPWGKEAFSAAAAADRPILLDIGAVWCHWCHVMDGESYEDPALAGFLNEHFVCIKVDRDERPDVDARYQRAVQAVARQGGWPLTGFLTPEAELFFGGTYFPPQALYGRPSFLDVLGRVLEVWRGERDRVTAQALAVRNLLTTGLVESLPGEVTPLVLDDAAHRMLATADRSHGGFGGAPKFPHPATLTFLLHRWCDTPEPTVRSVLYESLDGMAQGGFRDLLGGGFHRYSVDERWRVPHFEKLSSDNAELLRLYADAAALFHNDRWRDVARETIRWLREVLADPAGGFAASQDADVGLEDDGDYFTWTVEELRGALAPDELDLAMARFGLGGDGRMPHAPERNVLSVAASAGTLAERFGLDRTSIETKLTALSRKLIVAREARRPPFVDRTRYANWNALVAGALLRAGPILGDSAAVEQGLGALDRIRREQTDPRVVAHVANGPTTLLDDPVQCAAAALDAFEATGAREWLDWSGLLMDAVWEGHWDPERGGLIDVAGPRRGEGLLDAPVKPIQDSPNASPNGVAGQTVARLFELTRAPRWHERHQALVTAFGTSAAELGLFASAYLLAADWLVRPANHVVITGNRGDPLADELHQRALAAFLPRRVVVRLFPGAESDSLPPALRAMSPEAGPARGYLCTGDRCLAPAEDPQAWSTALGSVLPVAPPLV